MSEATAAYRAARDQLLELRGEYEKAASQFTWPDVGDQFNWAVDWFDAVARGNDKPALVVVHEDGSASTVTFDEMSRRSDQVANWFASIGVKRGDPVIVMLGNQVELWETMLAIMKLGAIVMPTTTAVPPADLLDRVVRGGAKHVIAAGTVQHTVGAVEGDFTRIVVGELGELPGHWHDYADAASASTAPPGHPGTGPEDSLLLYFTSGTTSKPKLVEHTQVSYPVGHMTTMFWLGLQPGDVHLNISSPGWAKHAWSCFFAPWIAEATVLVLDYARFDANNLLKTLQNNHVTTFCAPPTVWRMLIQADLSTGSGNLREVCGAGEPLNPEIIEQVKKHWGLTLRDGFGQTEMTAAIGNPPGSVLKPGSMGRPLPGYPVVLVDPLSGVVSDTEGEVCLDLEGPTGRPLGLMTGYQGDDERNAEAMAGGRYHTGDVATIDADGYLTFVGRTDDVFKASDYKISPFELESVLIEHPAVAEAAVVPAPDPVRLAVPKAFIVLAEGWDANSETAFQIFKYARERLSPWQRVRRIEFSPLPKTISGKIRRVELRSRETDLAAGGQHAAGEWRDEQFPELRGLA